MKLTQWKTIAGLTALALGIPSSALASWPAFSLYQINGIGGYPTQAFAVNAHSQIAGMAQPGNNSLVTDGLFGGAGYTSQITPIPNGWTAVEFTGINDSDYMIGQGMISGHPTAVGAEYNGVVVDMTAGIPFSYFSQAMGVNHTGQAVGYYNQEGNSGVDTHMFRWSNVSNSRTFDLKGYLPGGINENGTITASNLMPINYYMQAELDFFPTSGPMTKALAPGDMLYIYPSGISTYGGVTAIGQAYLQQLNASNTHMVGYAYNQAANQWSGLDAPGNPFYESNALAVDVWGLKIAGSTVDGNSVEKATVWEYDNGQWVASYLSDLFPADSTWQYKEATGINTYGAISGWGLHLENNRWVQRAFVATPRAFFHLVLPEGGIYGGLTVNPSVHVNGLNPFNVNFNVMCDSDLVSVPRSVEMPGMADIAQFSMPTMGVDRPTRVNLTTHFGGLSSTDTVLLLPAVFQALIVPSTIHSDGASGRVYLRGEAGPSGVVVSLASSSPALIVPATVTVPDGSASAPFRIRLGKGATKGEVVTITATYGTQTSSQQITIQ